MKWGAAGVVLVAVAVIIPGRIQGPEGSGSAEPGSTASRPWPPVAVAAPPSVPARSSSSAGPHSPLADLLADPAMAPQEEVRLVRQLFSQYTSALQNRPGPPVGDNEDLVKVLTGRNPLKRALLPPDHARLDARGRLCDRWGRPFHIHAISGRWIEVRSAGPDGTLFTADDVVEPPPP
ncbi:MAG: hypothetical protein KGS60_12675 [Verrucomicrobia bacterium]|nr:hypothetical protein [Verrucomicrobiota bacterium]